MKIKTEKLPKSRLALDIELDQSQVEKGLDRAARRLSEKHQIPGFRKGKVPRFIIERYLGRDVLMEEASGDLINRAFKEALKQENIVPIGQSSVESIDPSEPFQFRIVIPIPPTITLPDYRSIRIPLEIEPVTDETIESQLEAMREQHTVLRELDESRPAQDGDQLTLKFRFQVDGTWRGSGEEEFAETTIVLSASHILPELYHGLVGVQVDERREITAQVPDDHPNEQICGQEVIFDAQVIAIHERILPEWDELPGLVEFDGTFDELREHMHQNMGSWSKYSAEQAVLYTFREQLLEETEYDIPDMLIEQTAQNFLEEQEEEYQHQGTSLEQVLQSQGKTREQLLEEMLPEAERQLKLSLILQEIIRHEDLNISEEEVQNEIAGVLHNYQGDINQLQDPSVAQRFIFHVAQGMMDRKLRERLIAIATGTLPADEPTDNEATPEPDTEALPEPAPTEHESPIVEHESPDQDPARVVQSTE